MQKEFRNILNLIIAFAVVLLIFTLARVYFLGLLIPESGGYGDLNLLNGFLYGFVYDVEFVLGINGIIILLFFFPFKLRNTIFWQFIVRIVFAIINSFSILVYVVDAKYYHQMHEHIQLINLSKGSMLSQFVSSWQSIGLSFNNSWEVFAFLLVVFIGLWQVFPSISKMHFERSKANLYTRYALSITGIALFFNILFVLNDNSGSWQTKAFKRMNKPTAVLAINSPYAILKFYLSEQLIDKKYFDKANLEAIFSVAMNFIGKKENKKNIFLINIVQAENANELNVLKKLDASALISNNFIADKMSSLMQMDELLLSVPAFGKTGLMKTTYAFKQFRSLANILKPYGYYSIMANSSLNAKHLKSNANFYGFDKLIAGKKVDKILSGLNKERNKSPDKLFFVFFQIKTGLISLINYFKEQNLLNKSLIIINLSLPNKVAGFGYGKTVFLFPDNKPACLISDKMQNMDILPTVIDYLKLDAKFISFGKSIFSCPDRNEVFQYTGRDYLILDDSLLLRYNGQATKWLIDYKNDPDEFFDLQDSLPVQKVQMENKIRAIIEQYNNRLIGKANR